MESPEIQMLGTVLQLMLDAPVTSVLEKLGANFPELQVPQDITSVKALLEHPSPPLELLDAIFLAAQSATSVPRSTADVLQLVAMSVAMARCGFEVPPFEQPIYHDLFEVAVRLEWIDEATREILDDGLTAMTEARSESPASTAPAASDPSQSTDAANAATAGGLRGGGGLSKSSRPKSKTAAPAERRMPRGIFAAFVIAALGGSALYYNHEMMSDDGPVLEGWIESAEGNRISGWAWNSSKPYKSVEVVISDGVHPSTTVLADMDRPEFRFDGPGTKRHGFVYEIPKNLRDGKVYTITARIAGTNFSLNASPVSVAYAR